MSFQALVTCRGVGSPGLFSCSFHYYEDPPHPAKTTAYVSPREAHPTSQTGWRRRQAIQLCCHKPRNALCHQELREARKGFSSREEAVWHCWHFDFCLLAFRTETESISAALNHPVCIICYRQPLRMNIIYINRTISIKTFLSTSR